MSYHIVFQHSPVHKEILKIFKQLIYLTYSEFLSSSFEDSYVKEEDWSRGGHAVHLQDQRHTSSPNKPSDASAGTMQEDLTVPCLASPQVPWSWGLPSFSKYCWAEKEKMTMSQRELQRASQAEK